MPSITVVTGVSGQCSAHTSHISYASEGDVDRLERNLRALDNHVDAVARDLSDLDSHFSRFRERTQQQLNQMSGELSRLAQQVELVRETLVQLADHGRALGQVIAAISDTVEGTNAGIEACAETLRSQADQLERDLGLMTQHQHELRDSVTQAREAITAEGDHLQETLEETSQAGLQAIGRLSEQVTEQGRLVGEQVSAVQASWQQYDAAAREAAAQQQDLQQRTRLVHQEHHAEVAKVRGTAEGILAIGTDWKARRDEEGRRELGQRRAADARDLVQALATSQRVSAADDDADFLTGLLRSLACLPASSADCLATYHRCLELLPAAGDGLSPAEQWLSRDGVKLAASLLRMSGMVIPAAQEATETLAWQGYTGRGVECLVAAAERLRDGRFLEAIGLLQGEAAGTMNPCLTQTLVSCFGLPSAEQRVAR